MKISNTAKNKLRLALKLNKTNATIGHEDNDSVIIVPLVSATRKDSKLDEGLWDACLEITPEFVIIYGCEGCSGHGYSAVIKLFKDNLELSSIEVKDHQKMSSLTEAEMLAEVKACELEDLNVLVDSSNGTLSKEEKYLVMSLGEL